MANLNIDNVNQRDENNRTPLHINVFVNKSEVVKNLLENGADASLTSNKGNTPLHTATSRKYHRLVEILLKYSSRDNVRKFIDAKTTESGSTALHVAASNGCIESVRHLLSYGANFEVTNKIGKRPIDVATDVKVKKLLANVEFDAQLAAEGSYKKLQIRLYDEHSIADLKASVYARNNNGMTSLQMAVMRNHSNTVYRIIETRVDRLQGELGIPDATASPDEFVEYGRAVSARHLALIMHAEDVNVIGAKNMTEEIAIMLATAWKIVKHAEKVFKPANGEPYEQSSLLACIEETLEALGFEPEHVTYNKAGKFVFRGQKARYIQMLYGKKGDDDVYDSFKSENKIISYMGILQVGISRAIAMFMRGIFSVKLNIAASQNDFEMFDKCIEERFVDVNVFDHNRRTPLHHAAKNGNEKMVKMLLQKKSVIIKFQDELNKETALHMAAQNGHVGVIKLLLQSIRGEELKTFIDMKTSKEGWTALHFAAKSGQLQILKCLLEFGATYDLQDKAGKTPCGLSENMLVTQFLKAIVEMFQMAKNGDAGLPEKLRALQNNELLAIGNARNSSGCTIMKIAEMRGHQALASQVAKMVENVTPDAPEIQNRHYYEDHEIDGFRLMNALSKSST